MPRMAGNHHMLEEVRKEPSLEPLQVGLANLHLDFGLLFSRIVSEWKNERTNEWMNLLIYLLIYLLIDLFKLFSIPGELTHSLFLRLWNELSMSLTSNAPKFPLSCSWQKISNKSIKCLLLRTLLEFSGVSSNWWQFSDQLRQQKERSRLLGGSQTAGRKSWGKVSHKGRHLSWVLKNREEFKERQNWGVRGTLQILQTV